VRIRVLSDLHLEFQDWSPPAADADVVVLAGDIHLGTQGLTWATERFPGTPVVYVAGNHEFYHGDIDAVREEMRSEGARLGVHVLDGDVVVLDGVRFLGATLWTDFALYGSDPSDVERAMRYAERAMSDFRLIGRAHGRPFRAQDALEIHREQVRWLAAELARPFAGPSVVVTHHLPHVGSMHPKFSRDPLNPAFGSDLARLVRSPVELWIHGHTHESFDYTTEGVRVRCNPRGYLPMEPNHAFDPLGVLRLDDSPHTDAEGERVSGRVARMRGVLGTGGSRSE
jgi:predicted phosphodiesterase